MNPKATARGPGRATERDRKLAELILYIARKTEGDVHCGATKINKILYFAEERAYRKLGATITGQRYQKLEHGPAPRRLVPVVNQLLERRDCAYGERSVFGYQQKRLIALREPDLSPFTAAEIDVVAEVIQELWALNGKEVSLLSHSRAGWNAVDFGEDIPFETTFVGSPRALTSEEIAVAHRAIDELLASER